MPSEQLVHDIFVSVMEITGDTIVTACLFRLADRGVFTVRELPEVARQLRKRYGDTLVAMGDGAVNYFASTTALPLSAPTGGHE